MIIIKLALLLFICAICGCGRTIENTYYKQQPPPYTEWQETYALIEEHCETCHNGSIHPLEFNSEKIWLESKAKQKIESNQMPPNKALTAEEKESLLESFN